MEKEEIGKFLAFGIIVILVLGITAYLVWSTITTNVKSVTLGPVHWHADFENWSCGQKVDLIDPKGWSNRIGIPILHEHNDNRIHVEGPVLAYQNISLGKFFEVVGGRMSNNSLVVPINKGIIRMENGMECGGVIGQLQIFVYKTKGDTFHQEKLTEPQAYVLSPHTQVPPGDCIIIEFGPSKAKTDRLCNFYKIAVQKGQLNER